MTERWVKLNVGGVHFETTVKTLTAIEGTMLHTMFNSELTREDKIYRFDSDPKMFAAILNGLRRGAVDRACKPSNVSDEMWERELNYWAIPVPAPAPSHHAILTWRHRAHAKAAWTWMKNHPRFSTSHSSFELRYLMHHDNISCRVSLEPSEYDDGESAGQLFDVSRWFTSLRAWPSLEEQARLDNMRLGVVAYRRYTKADRSDHSWPLSHKDEERSAIPHWFLVVRIVQSWMPDS